MADLMQQARELLAAEYEGNRSLQARVLHGHHDDAPYFKAVAAALRAAPEGFVIVPVEPTEEMLRAGWRDEGDYGVSVGSIYKAMLAARPQGVKDGR